MQKKLKKECSFLKIFTLLCINEIFYGISANFPGELFSHSHLSCKDYRYAYFHQKNTEKYLFSFSFAVG